MTSDFYDFLKLRRVLIKIKIYVYFVYKQVWLINKERAI